MQHLIAGGILEAFATLALASIAWGLLSAAFGYLRDHRWPMWVLGGLVCAVVYISHAGLWGYVWDHAALIALCAFLALPLAMAAVMELEARAERRARERRRAARGAADVR
jgi:MFS superfamily sulfate permease-like transporter